MEMIGNNITTEDIPKCVINLPHRTDRLLLFREEYNKIFNSPLTIINGVISETPMSGIVDAQMSAINWAINIGAKYVCIMEDDCLFRDGAKEYIKETFKHLPNDWEILLGGASTLKIESKYNEYWSKVKKFTGGHFLIVNSSVFHKYLQMDREMLGDNWISQSNFKLYITNKIFVTQYNSFSDQVNKDVDYTRLFNKLNLL
jgi:hypothetical protein